jgi:hypothetical protein
MDDAVRRQTLLEQIAGAKEDRQLRRDEFGYRKGRDTIGDQHWQQTFDAGRTDAAAANARADRLYNLQASKLGRNDDINSYEYARNNGYAGSFEDWINAKRQGTNSFYGNLIYGTRPDGSTGIGVTDKRGQFHEVTTPGFTPTPGIKTIDTGTGTVVVDSRSGIPLGGTMQPGQPAQPKQQSVAPGYIPKDVQGKAQQQKFGTEQGDAQGRLASLSSKMPGLETVVKTLDGLADQATYTMVGQAVDEGRRQLGMQPREAAVARAQYISIVDNQILPLLRDTFGSQFTEREGNSLRATLGDPNRSPKEKQAILKSFIEQKRRDVLSLRRQTGGGFLSQAGSNPIGQAAPQSTLPPPPAGFQVIQ